MKTKKQLIKTLLLVALIPSMGCVMQACGDKTKDPTPTTKTLDKTKLIGKKWYPSPQVIVHEFKASGVYSGDGTWKWVNNSDTMEIVYSAGDAPVKWKFYWSADHEMACNRVGESGEVLYKDAAW